MADRKEAWHAAALVAAALLVHGNTLRNAFVWDDLHLIVGNPAIKGGDALARALTADLFPDGVASGYYRPLQTLSYALDYRLWGLAPAGFHLTNVLWHAATAVLLHRLGSIVLASPTAAFLGALLFTVHPIHGEAVAYVAGRSDPLAATFMLVAVLAFLADGTRARVVSVGAFFLALLAREAAVVLPLLLAVVDRAVPDRSRRSVRAYLPYAAVVLVWLALRAVALDADPTARATAAVPLGLRLLTECEVVARYFALLLVPVGLHMERVVTPVASPLDPRALASVALLLAVALAAWQLRARARPLVFGLAWFVVALLPVANVVPLATFMAEHWLYVPSMGLFLAAGWALATGMTGRSRPAALAIAALAVVAYGGVAVRRNLDWRDARTLNERLLPLAPASLRVRVNLAQAYQEAGEVERARVLYEETVRLHPAAIESADALNNLGNIHREAGRAAEALAAYDRALALSPRHVPARNGRALALQVLGRVDEAERELATALALAPDSATSHSNLGNLHFRRGDFARARDAYLAAVRLDPEHADAHNNLGSAYVRLGRRDLAEREYRTALRLNPASDGARRNLAIVTGDARPSATPVTESSR